MLLTTFTQETLTGCQTLDTFQKSTYVERLAASKLISTEDDLQLWWSCVVGINSIASTVPIIWYF